MVYAVSNPWRNYDAAMKDFHAASGALQTAEQGAKVIAAFAKDVFTPVLIEKQTFPTAYALQAGGGIRVLREKAKHQPQITDKDLDANTLKVYTRSQAALAALAPIAIYSLTSQILTAYLPQPEQAFFPS